MKKICRVCGQEFESTGNGQQYCVPCGVEVRRQQVKIRKARWRLNHPGKRAQAATRAQEAISTEKSP